MKLTFSSFATENTAETAAGEQPFLTLSFAKIEGNEVYARVGEEPFVVAVDRSLLEKIWVDPLRWQELSIFKFKPNDIVRFSRVTDREEMFERAGPAEWRAGKGEEAADQNHVQSLLNTLSSLHAVRWTGATTPAHGFDQPQLVLTFAVAKDPKTLRKLTIGNHTENGMWFAKVDSLEGTFVISNPDFTGFKLPLIKAPAVMPVPSVTPAAVSGSPASSPTNP